MFSFFDRSSFSSRSFNLTILASLTLLQNVFSTQTLIPAGAVWRYNADGSDQGTTWFQPGFDATAWPGGFGPLGFGDPHIATVLPSGFVTYYFRGEFTVNNPSTVSSLLLRLLRDDGAVVYLNGTEVRRDNMPAGPIAFNTLASVAVSGTGETNYFESAIPTALLVAGANVLAVEVHQNSISSSDLGFDAALMAEIGDTTPPTIVSANATHDGPTVTVLFSEPVEPNGATDVFNYSATGSDGSPVSFDSATISADQHTVTLFLSAFTPFVQGVSYTLDACCICDTSFNCMPGTQSIPITFPSVPSTLVARGSVWRYLDTAVDPGPSWFDPLYDDSFWRSGPAELGYGDNDEATVINRTDPNTGTALITAYFRQTFNVADSSGIPGLSLHLWRDDGAIVYINGTEVFRNNMPEGSVNYSTLANALAQDDGDIALDVPLASSVLVNGANVIAVEVHQQSPFSSDISFDLELLLGNVPPNERPVANSQSVVVQFNTPTPITLTGFDQNNDPLTYIIVTSPAHGSLSGTPPNVTYTPNANFTGADSFTFKVNDGQLDSAVATVALDVQPGSTTLIAKGSVWRYLDTGIDPGTIWISPSFDDSNWRSGPAELGYGDFNEATVINSTDSSGQRLITAYFRRTFNVIDASAISSLSLRLWRDDGAIVYLNGAEVFRNNMPEGPVSYSTFAPTVAQDDGNIAVLAQLSASHLANGANVMAVEVHQQSLTSSDISFDLQLDPVGSSSECTPPPQGLVAWWPFDGSAKDVQGHHPTTLVGNPAFITGKVARALQFDYVDDAVRVPAASTLDVGQGSGFTIEAWIQPNELSLQHPIVEWNDDIGGIGAHFWTTVQDFDGQIKSLFANIIDVDGVGHGIVAPPDLLTTAAFQHVALTYDKASGLAALYVGGSAVAQQNLGTFTPQTSTHLYIGYRSSGTAAGNRFSGSVDEVSLYNRSLSSAEIATIAAAGSSGKCKPPPSNDPPTANNQSVTTHQNEPVAITLTGSDPDGDPLSFTVTSTPAHGTLSGTPPNLTYTPAANFLGSDAFTFTVSDGQFESTNALVSIQVVPPPNPPDIVSAIAGCNGLNVVLMFDEPVDPATATDPFNYTISDSAGNSAIIMTVTLIDPQTVMLGLEASTPLIPGQPYILDAFFICDTGGDCSGQLTVPIQFETVPPQVSCSVAVHTLLPANNQLVNVGLSASSSEGTLQVKVFSDEPKVPVLQDAVFTNGNLQLRARKSPSSDGRVYLIVITAADPCGNVGVCCTTVVIPATGTQASINAVNAQAAAARAQCSPTGAPSTPYQILP